MAENVTLTAAVRSNLLSLQNTTDLINRTQGRLATGLKVASPIDDPVAYFQAKGLNDRASDFTQKKQGIDQGISTLTAATDAIDGIESLVSQLKGLVLNAKAATTSTEIDNIITQFNDLRNQIGFLANDAQYQGLNLVNGTGQTLKVDFSNNTGSVLNVNSVDVTVGANGLRVGNLVSQDSNVNFNWRSQSTTTLDLDNATAGTTITVTVGGASAQAFSAGATHTFTYGGQTLTLSITTDEATNGISSTGSGYSVGTVLTLNVGDGATAAVYMATTEANVTFTEVTGRTVAAVNTTSAMNGLITDLDSALTTLRSRAQVLGSNIALLQTRLDFTDAYVNTLTAGAGKLNLADLNEEGANLLALQTRQQLGIQALSFAGQAEQGILGLFR